MGPPSSQRPVRLSELPEFPRQLTSLPNKNLLEDVVCAQESSTERPLFAAWGQNLPCVKTGKSNMLFFEKRLP
jgi:hypothetical protein